MSRLSRRRLLRVAGAAGISSLALGNPTIASAQTGGPVEWDRLLTSTADIGELQTGLLNGAITDRPSGIDNIDVPVSVGKRPSTTGEYIVINDPQTPSNANLTAIEVASGGSWSQADNAVLIEDDSVVEEYTDADIEVGQEGEWVPILDVATIPESGADNQWNFDEEDSADLTVRDTIGSLDAPFSGGTWASGTGTDGVYLDLDGSDDGADLGADSRSSFAHFVNNLEGTFFAWVYPETLASGDLRMVASSEVAPDRKTVNFYNGGGNAGDDINVSLGDGNGNYITTLTATAGFELNEWQAVGWVCDGGNARIYAANQANNWTMTELASESISGAVTGDLDGNVGLGYEQTQNQRYWDGRIDLCFKDSVGWSQSELQEFVDSSRNNYTTSVAFSTLQTGSIGHPPHQAIWPQATYLNGSTYFATISNQSNATITVSEFDHSSESVVATNNLQSTDVEWDAHHQPAIAATDDGHLHVIFGGWGDTLGDQKIYYESTNAEDVTAFESQRNIYSEIGEPWGTGSSSMSYCRLHTAGNQLVFPTRGNSGDRPSAVVWSDDTRGTWTHSECAIFDDVSDENWLYPHGSELDSGTLHVAISNYNNTDGTYNGCYHYAFDLSTEEIITSDGSRFTSRLSQSDMDSNGSTVYTASATDSIVQGLRLVNGEPHILLSDWSDSTDDKLLWAKYGTGWSTATVDPNAPITAGHNGVTAEVSQSDIVVRFADGREIDRYVSTDAGDSWSIEERADTITGVELSGTNMGLSRVINGDPPLTHLAGWNAHGTSDEYNLIGFDPE